MDYFANYFAPLTHWIDLHPSWALWITFIISFSESLAFIGSLIPGSVTMTAIGILAGSGTMRIDLTMIAAVLGAIVGDSISYSLGHLFSDRLIHRWPFSRYPQWIEYGKNYFLRHGGKSVFLGRFIGPLRSVIPIIAGMIGMNRWHFFAANIASAIGWVCLYLIPGILIGYASSDLSTQSASKLFLLILCLLACIWLLSLGVKWLFIAINHWLKEHLSTAWLSLLNHRLVARQIQFLTPQNEVNHYATAALSLLFLLCLALVIPLALANLHSDWVHALNESVYQFCLSIRTQDFDAFFIVVRLDLCTLTQLCFSLAIIVYALYHKDWRLLRFWISLTVMSFILVHLMTLCLINLTDTHPRADIPLFTLPAQGLTVATGLFGFLVFYLSTFYTQVISILLRILLIAALMLSGIAIIYLGEEWLSNVVIAYLIGLTNGLGHWILYRRLGKPHYRTYLPITLSVLFLLIATALSSLIFFEKIAEHQQPYTKQYVIQHEAWWEQQHPLLPLYSTNRFGKKIGLLNIQFVGSIQTLQQSLQSAGWKKQRDSFFYSLLLRIGQQQPSTVLPLMAQLYMNKKPYLVMTYDSVKEEDNLIIRFWRSNYHINNQDQIIWLGSLQQQATKTKQLSTGVLDVLFQSLTHFQTKTLIIHSKGLLLPYKISPNILLIEQIGP